MVQKFWDMKLVRFGCVGIFNTLFDLSILNALVFLVHIPTLIANLISASISIAVSYFLNHRIVFRSTEEYSLRRFIHFFLVTGTGILIIQTLVIYGVTHVLSHQQAVVNNIVDTLPFKHLTPAIFKLNVAKLTAVFAAMVWNFTIYHFFIFNDKSQDDAEDAVLPY